MKLIELYQKKIYPNLQYLFTKFDSVKYRNYVVSLPENFASDISQKYQKVMRICEGEYEYEYFNFCYLNNVLSLVIFCLRSGFLPSIEINHSKSSQIQWTWYFEQPFHIEPTIPCQEEICPRRSASFQPHFEDIYNPEMIKLWGKIYNQCMCFNTSTYSYIQEEYRSLISPYKRVLGIICRGTDYTSLDPPGHPVQPSVQEVISYCQEHMKNTPYDAIYLATEERKIRDAFAAAFPGKILENKRKYYDDIYYSDNSIQYIKDVHFQRENDDYLSGLEYLSSITLLSRCTSLVGGNCTGTMAAVFLNSGRYEHVHIFDYGLYPFKE